jgi:hypothetical protein
MDKVMFQKIQYQIVALEVEKMFSDSVKLTDPDQINKKFDSIREFIEACGWSYEDYTNRMMGWESYNQS